MIGNPSADTGTLALSWSLQYWSGLLEGTGWIDGLEQVPGSFWVDSFWVQRPAFLISFGLLLLKRERKENRDQFGVVWCDFGGRLFLYLATNGV